MQHFSVEELKQIKATVIQQHFKVETEDEAPEKCVQDNKSSMCLPLNYIYLFLYLLRVAFVTCHMLTGHLHIAQSDLRASQLVE